MRISLTALLLLTFTQLFAQSESEKDLFELSNYLIKSAESSKVISEPCAVYVQPTAERIEELIEEYGEEDFYTIADDNNWYEYRSFQLLQKLNIKSINIESEIVTLQGVSNAWTMDMYQAEAPAWNFILFNPNKDPKIASTAEISEQELKEYFGIE